MSEDKLTTEDKILETQEWLDAMAAVIEREGEDRAKFLLDALHGQIGGAHPKALDTPCANTIPVTAQPNYPGNMEYDIYLTNIHRWNAMVMLLKAKKKAGDVGGHLSSYASIANTYEVGLNYFFRADSDERLGDLIYFQGHSSEYNYARSYFEGRFDEERMLNFRQEAETVGLSSYPHPWLMKDYWQFATVSLGLGGLQAVYQARFLKYIHNRGLADTTGRKVWCFIGDGEMDESQSTAGALLASREKLDNLIYVINCNLQRLDGCVRSNYRVIPEFERLFRGAGWNVIKVMWGRLWDPLFAKDTKNKLREALAKCIDGDLQNLTSKDGKYIREHFFAKDPDLLALVADMSDDDLHQLFLNRGGVDREKIYAAYEQAVNHKGQPTVILMHSIKGFRLTGSAESKNIAHNSTSLTDEEILAYRDRLKLDLSDEEALALEFYKPERDKKAQEAVISQREKLGGFLPARRTHVSKALAVPARDSLAKFTESSGDKELSTTMAVARILAQLLKDKTIGERIVPIFSDEARTFGMESLFRSNGIYSPEGQRYTPEDKKQLMYYREAKDGQVLQEGITEDGCMASWIASATSYSTSNLQTIPFFIYYSMFGFQRVGDFIWAAADMRSRGFLVGGTAGRTTLAGEGLQHQDGTSLLSAAGVPNCMAYDPAFSYEIAIIVQEGLRRMVEDQEDIFYYFTCMNEKYQQPQMPKNAAEGILRGMYLFQEGDSKAKLKVQLLTSGAIFNETLAAAELLANDFNVHADVWGVPGLVQLYRDGAEVERQNRLNPTQKAKQSYVEQCLAGRQGPVITATDYVRAYGELIRPYVPADYTVLGTDGFGRSDKRDVLRRFFEVDRYYIATAALSALARAGDIPQKTVAQALKKYKINRNKPNPVSV